MKLSLSGSPTAAPLPYSAGLPLQLAAMHAQYPTVIEQDLLALAHAWQQGDTAQAHQLLLQTTGALFRDARSLQGAVQQHYMVLAKRFYLLARSLEAAPVGITTNAAQQQPQPQPAHASDAPETTEAAVSPVAAHISGGLDTVVGHDALKELLRARFVYPLQQPALARRYRQSGAGGLLLFGPPGTGKTHMVRALAAELQAPVWVLNASSLLSKWMGESEKQLAAIFAQARQHPLSLMFIDEIDTLAPARDAHTEAGGPMQRLLAQLLVELDGFERQSGKLVFVGATNRPWDIDAALLRPGRLDALAYVGLPDCTTRTALLQQQLHDLPHVQGLDWLTAAHSLPALSAAETVAVALHAARLAFLQAVHQGQDHPINLHHLQQAATHIHRATDPALLRRFRHFAQQHGVELPTD